MTYKEIKKKYPKLNWQEAEEIDQEELEAAASYFNRMLRNRE